MAGNEKSLLKLGNHTLLEHVLCRFESQVGKLIINANGDPARFGQFGLTVVADSVEGFAGPLAGVLAGMDWASEHGYQRIATVAGDTPFFPKDLVDRLYDVTHGNRARIVLAAAGGPGQVMRCHPTFGLWPVCLADDLRNELANGMRKIAHWTTKHGAVVAEFETGSSDPFFNVNTPEELAAAERMCAGGPW